MATADFSSLCTVHVGSSLHILKMFYAYRSQWSSSNMPDCGVTGHGFESHRQQIGFITTATPGLPSRTIARTVSSSYSFFNFSLFLFLCRALN